MAYDAELGRVAARQLGLVTTDDIRAAGLTYDAWSDRVNAGAWVRIFPRVYRTAQARQDPRQRALGALLSAGPSALLSHRTAAWILGLDGFRPPPDIDITVPPGTRPRRSPGLVAHVCKLLLPADRLEVPPFRVTSGTKTLLDLAGCTSRRELENAMDSALRLRLTTLQQLDQRQSDLRRGSIRFRDVLHGQPQGGLHTRLERDFLAISRAVGLPDPIGQAFLRKGTTFLARVDFRFHSMGLVVEVAGHRTHSTRQERSADAARQRRLVAAGHRVIEFTSDDVFHDPQRVRADLQAFAEVHRSRV